MNEVSKHIITDNVKCKKSLQEEERSGWGLNINLYLSMSLCSRKLHIRGLSVSDIWGLYYKLGNISGFLSVMF